MSNILRGDGRTHIESRLMRESLQDRDVIAGTDSDRDIQIFPEVTLVGIGGQANHMDAPYGIGFLRALGSRKWFNAFAQEKTQH